MDDTRLSTIAQLEQFLSANAQVGFAPHGDDAQRYAHISRVLQRLDYPRRTKRERGVVLAYLRHTSGYSRAQLTRLVRRWCWRRFKIEPPCRLNFEPGLLANL